MNILDFNKQAAKEATQRQKRQTLFIGADWSNGKDLTAAVSICGNCGWEIQAKTFRTDQITLVRRRSCPHCHTVFTRIDHQIDPKQQKGAK